MGSMPTYHVSKGSEFKFLETELFGNSAFMENYDLALGALANPESTATLTAAANHRHEENPDDVSTTDLKHFTKHWLSGWWSEPPVAYRCGSDSSRRSPHARTVEKPMEVIWVCAEDRRVPHLLLRKSEAGHRPRFHAGCPIRATVTARERTTRTSTSNRWSSRKTSTVSESKRTNTTAPPTKPWQTQQCRITPPSQRSDRDNRGARARRSDHQATAVPHLVSPTMADKGEQRRISGPPRTGS